MLQSRSIALAVAMALILPTCRQESKPPTARPKEIVIATLMAHPALDAVQHGIVAQLKREGFVDGKTVRITYRNANGQMELASSIAQQAAAAGPDVIVAVTTPMAQAVKKAAHVPVVFAAVTDPVGAGLVGATPAPGATITGSSDAWPYHDQLKLIRQISPNVRTIGVLYNPGEAASQYGIREIRRLAAVEGFKLVEGPVNATTEVYGVARQLAARCDALFLSSDNTVIAARAAALKVTAERKIPLYVGDSGTVEGGGLATVSVGYERLGAETGKLVARVLRGERGIPTYTATGDEIYINTAAASAMGVKIPPDVLRRATRVYTSIKQ